MEKDQGIGIPQNEYHKIFQRFYRGSSNCMYAMGMLVGAYIIRFVPEVASWLIPGGVSSGTGSVAGSAAMGITSAAGGMAGSMTGSAMKGTGSAVRSLVK